LRKKRLRLSDICSKLNNGSQPPSTISFTITVFPMDKEFIELINRHRGLVYKICHLYTNDRDDRDDLFQDIVLQLWRAFPSFRKESLITTWMYRVALNTAISWFRREKRKPGVQRISGAELQLAELEPTAETEVLHQAIQHLTQVEKAIIILYLDEKSYQEISEVMGITLSNVGVKINRIKTKLEKIIKTITV
jgi:RNA polymerase sigma factor (sigma-70 family)